MSVIILFCAVVIFTCIFTNKFSSKLGMPTLLIFMLLGILFGEDGILKLSYNDYDLTSKLCSIALLLIIFYGGFCTKKPENKKIGFLAGGFIFNRDGFNGAFNGGFLFLRLKNALCRKFSCRCNFIFNGCGLRFFNFKVKKIKFKIQYGPRS